MTNRIFLIDNLKVLLILLVIFGHFIEIFNNIDLEWLYKTIYMIHMPSFTFISGYLFKKKGRDFFIFHFKIYIVFQTLYVIFDSIILKQDQTKLLYYLITPKYLMWYIFSFIFWTLISNYIQRVKLKHIISFAIFSILAGLFFFVDRYFSISRTLYFLPFFLTGRYIKENGLDMKGKSYMIPLSLFGIILLLIIGIDIKILWAADSYKASDTIYRILLYLVSFSLIPAILFMIPKKDIGLIKISNNTMSVYLIHGFFIKYIKYLDLQISSAFSIVVIGLVFSVLCVLLLSKIKLKL